MAKTAQEIGKELFKFVKKKEAVINPFDTKWWNNQLLKMSMQDSGLKDQLFRFVDVLPNLKDKEQVSKYLAEYIGEWNKSAGALVSKTKEVKGMNVLSEMVVKASVKVMAKTFIVGSNADEAIAKIKENEKRGLKYTLDILGELAVSEEESEKYLKDYIDLIKDIPNANISVKLSALYSQVNPVAYEESKEAIKDRLREIYRAAIENDAFVNVDLEHYNWKDLFIDVVKELLLEEEFRTWKNAGLVIQAYLVDSKPELKKLVEWSKKRGTPIMVRLVKGAYWDYEKTMAEQHHWPIPVFTDKAETDLNYEECTKFLFDNHRYLKPAIASHNIRSISHALSLAEKHKLKRGQFEFQMLYGMMDPLKDYLSKEGVDVRVYMPYGDLIPGMAYLVRRLLENTANESFLKQGFADKIGEDVLLQNPKSLIGTHAYHKNGKHHGAKISCREQFVNEPNLDFSIEQNRKDIVEAIEEAEIRYTENREFPLIVNSQEVFTDKHLESLNPSKYDQILGRVCLADKEHCEMALTGAQVAFDFWSKTEASFRAKVLKDIADAVRRDRNKFNALLVLESGKPWVESDGEVSEVVDFLEYYAALAQDLFNENDLISLPGESNRQIYVPRGVTSVISPWNFPLAIMGGMSVASIAAGNTVIVKPSAQASIVAYEFAKLVNESLEKNIERVYGDKTLAQGIYNYLPGPGRVVGAYLVEDPRVKLIAFTGSSEVGMSINEKAAADHNTPKQVIAEMGGKNTVIVDTTADLDEAVPGVLYSAFGFAGQKCSACSRVVVTEDIYDQFVDRLVEAAKSIFVREAKEADCYLSPVIDKNSYEKVKEYIEIGKEEGKMLIGPGVNDPEIPSGGYFFPPTIFADIKPDDRMAQEEIFGPVLSVIKAKDIKEAIKIANNTVYGLTGGLFTRSPEVIKQVTNEFMVGNLYINRPCTGAIVARQSFGGLKLSSIGFKAGGPNYLKQFVLEKTVTENTMRRGFVVD